MSYGIGQPVHRIEDPRFLTGRGTYVDDIQLPRMAYGAVVYAQVAKATIRSLDTIAARQMPGVLDIITGQDLKKDNIGFLPPAFMPADMGGPEGYRAVRPILAHEQSKFVGDRIAFVVAETESQARDAAEEIVVDLKIEDPAIFSETAAIDGAPVVHQEAGSNVCYELQMGDEAAAETGLASADHIVKLTIYNNRITTNSMEPRGCIGQYDPSQQHYTIWSSTQNIHGLRLFLAQHVFHVPESRLRVIAKDVGGGFGMKNSVHQEEALVLWASRRISRPVKWIAARSESHISDDQGRDQLVTAELGLNKYGKFTGLRWRGFYNAGAYLANSGNIPIQHSLKLAPTVYDIPATHVAQKLVYTNTAPMAPYRGAGRPEAVFCMERLIDLAAKETGFDRIELRRINYIDPENFPYTTATGFKYDSGEFAATMDKCLELSDSVNFENRRQSSEANGKLRGLGIIYYIDNCGNFNERMELHFDPSGGLTLKTGTLSHGQGHETVFTQMLCEKLGIEPEFINFVQGDTDQVPFGRGTYASRSMTVGGNALIAAADDIIQNGKKFAAHYLEANPDDIEFENGVFRIAGTDRKINLDAVVKRSFAPLGNPVELGIGLHGVGTFGITSPSFPNGCHICELEIDPDTGATEISSYTVVDDIGRVLNPLLAHGQIHGGVAQGVGQALLEDMIYDRQSGQVLTGSFMDYGMPKADNFPNLAVETNEVLCRTNPLGVKGVGEGGTVGATPCVINAVLDALAPLGVTDIQTPATPKRIWEAIQSKNFKYTVATSNAKR
ncbi:MAG: carbon monoxide dehydrogenase [Rhodospirillaceae bacterium]|nr:carbon monoxide dehydrogenase [Rhodospirillaceae bacterium]